MHPAWPELLNTCFQSTEFMALASHGKQGVWVNPVYFAWDARFNLYFISQLDCDHMHNIHDDAAVACTIYPTDRPCGNNVFGAYVTGEATRLTDEAAMAQARQIYYGRIYPDDPHDQQKNQDSYYHDASWHIVKIKPRGLWYFDTRYFDENRVAVPPEVWQ